MTIDSHKGSVILVARHYPPGISGGTRRAFLLAKGLRSRGWRVRVASPQAPTGEPDWIDSPHAAAVRGSAAASRPSTRLMRTRTTVRNAVRSLVYWPDADMRWALATARRAMDVIAKIERPDWVISSSPPESAHLAGALIRRRTGVRWLAEFRDSWIEEPLREELRRSAVRRFVERRIASTLLRGADHVVAVSESIAMEVAALGASCPISLIGHFAEPEGNAHAFDGPGPHLVHTGQFSLSHPDRTLPAVLDAFRRIQTTFPTAMLHLVGRLTHAEVALAQQHPSHSHTQLYGSLPYAEARTFQGGADGLILYQPDTAALPGKISEYLLCKAPILTVGGGTWQNRIQHIPHWPLEGLADALAAGPREPIDLYADALDRYEALLLEPRVAQRGRSI